MKTRFNAFQRLLSVVLALTLVVGLVPAMSTTVKGATDDLRIFSNKKADPSTMDWEDFFGANKMDTEFAGMVWSDKSVYTAASNELPGITLNDGNNFLVSMSAIASNLTITGHTTAPTDTMLVLDLSGSMISTYEVGTIRQGYAGNYRYSEVSGRDVSLVEAMVDATNAAIDSLMAQNANNRVGVVLFSGNTSTGDAATSSTATVVLPLGRYAGVTNEYLSLDATYNENVALYEWVRTGGNRGSYQPTGEVVSYVPTNSSVSVSVKDGVTVENGNEVSGSGKTVVGGTYTQNGLYLALSEFEKVTDTRVPEGKVQSGADRVPAIVLMTDGAPTIATNDYSGVATSNTGNGGSENEMITFLTQLTAAYVRGAVSVKYTEEGASEQKVLFLTLGLGTENSSAATNTLYPAGTTGNVATAWNTYLAMADGATQSFSLGNYSRNITRSELVAEMNYVDKYYYATDANSLITSFEQIIEEIELKAEAYATRVENIGANFSGYVTFEDKLGEMMEVSHMKGILIGNHLYTGEELSKGMTAGNLGTPEEPNDKGNELIATVKERIPGTDTTAAQQLVHYAYLDKQLYWESADSWSNYIGWYADENGQYLGFWDKDSGYENAPAGALYANKSYGYLGENGNSDMMHVVVMVRTNLKTLHQTVFFKIPAALLPTVTYNVTLNEDTPDQVEAFTRDGAEPIQVVFEVGLRSDINSFNLEQKIQEHLARNEEHGTEHTHVHRNSDGSVTLYTNAWGSDNDTDNDGRVDYTEALTAKVAQAHFHPALENGRYYYTEDTLVLDGNGDPVTGAHPTDTDNNAENGTGYHHAHYIYSAQGRQTINMAITAATLANAQQNAAGQWYIPEGTMYQELSRFRNPKNGNTTGTLDYSDYAALFGTGGNQDVYNFLGNNGTITIAPVSGIALTKQVEGTIENVSQYSFNVTLSDASVTPVLTDPDGNAFPNNQVTMTANGGGSFTVTMPADVTAYLTGIPAGTDVTVTEIISGDYKVQGATVDGAAAAVVNNGVSLTVPAYSNTTPNLVVPVTFTNAPNGYGDLLVSKDVHYALPADPTVLASKVFTFQVKLTGDKIVPGTSTFATSNGTNVTVGADGTFTFQLKNEESIVIYDIPEGTTYTVTETGIEQGFKLDSINGDTTATYVTDDIQANTTATAAFINRYPAEFSPITLPLTVNVKKTIEGDDAASYTADEDFTFVLEWLVDGQYQPLATDTAKNGDTKALIASVPIPDVGMYEFRVTERIPDVRTPGMTYSTQRSLFNIIATDADMNGVLELAINNEAHTTVNITAAGATVETTFVNIYEYDSTPLTVNVQKQLHNNSGVAHTYTQFRFAMVPSDAQGTPQPGIDPTVINAGAQGYATFYTTLNVDSTYYYRIYEVMPAGATQVTDAASPYNGMYVLNGMYYDPDAYLLKVVTRVDGVTGKLVIDEQTMVKIGDTANVTTALFENTYDPADTATTIDVRKEISGLASSNEEFSFRINRTNDTYTSPVADPINGTTVKITGEGTNSFALQFSQAGTYHYVITEDAPAGAVNRTQSGMYYDDARYHVAITVEVDGNGALQVVNKTIHKLGSSAAVTEAAFTNTYTVTGEEQIVLSGLKRLSGRRLAAGEFSFGLYDADGQLLSQVANEADGSFTFPALRFTPADLGAENAEKEYVFTIQEIANGLGGMRYDTDTYEVVVTVSHENGQLAVSQTLENLNDPAWENTDGILFENVYEANDVAVTLQGSKVLTGNWDAVTDKSFTFHLHEADSSFAVTGAAPRTVTVSANDYVNGVASFAFNLNYADGDEGYYYFVLHEDTTAAAGGIGYDAGEYHITVNVADPGDGQLVAMVSMYRPGTGNIANDPVLHTPVATFRNNYSVEPVELQLTGTKKLTGRDMAAGEFGFLVLDAAGNIVSRGENTAAADGVASAITFQKITFTAPGTYTYTVVEEDGNLGGIDYDLDEVTVTVIVTDNGNGTMTAAVDTANSDTVAFENTYSVGEAELELTGTKTLTGDWSKVPAANKAFTFYILEGTTVESVGSADLSVNNTITFQKLRFSAAGVYNYTIVEVAPNANNGITYSDKVYTLVVTVTDNGDGTLSTSYTVDGTANGAITFENSYSTSPYRINLAANKQYKYQNANKTMNGGEFKFELTGNIGSTPVDQVKFNDSNGNVVFDELVFNAPGTYELTLEEIDKVLGFIEYSKASYKITVTVADNGTGALLGGYVVEKTGIHLAQEEDLTFVNTYNPYDATVSFSGNKELVGGASSGSFQFALYETGANYDITGITPVTVNAPAGAFAFPDITYQEEGTHYYVIRELPGTDPEMVYDGAQFKFKVEITDVSGQLKPVITDESAEAAVVVNNNADAFALVEFTNAPIEEVAKKEVFAANTSTAIDGQKVNVGDELRYEITYTNYTGTVTDVTIEDTLPQFTTLVSGSAAGAVVSGDKLTWTFSNVAPDETKTVSFSVTVDAPEAVYTNQAIVRDDVNDYTTNEVHNHTVEEIVKKDGALYTAPTISIDGKKVNVGDELVYTIDYTNVTGAPVTATITDRIPAHTAYVSNTATQGGVYTPADGTLVWTLQLDAWQSVQVSFRVKVSDVDAELSNTATVFDGANTVTSNEVTNHTYEEVGKKDVFAPAAPDISIDGKKVNAGDELIYKITYTNHTGKDAQVTVTDRIPAYTELVAGSVDNGGTVASDVITWNLTVPADQDITVSFKVKVTDEDVQIVNQALILEGGNTYDTNEVTNHSYEELGDKEVFNTQAPTVNIDGAAAAVGDELVYKITYTNYTGKEAQVTVTDRIPNHTALVDGSVDNGGTVADGVITWNLTVPADGAVTVSFKVKVTGGETVSNQALILEGGNWYGTNTVTTAIPGKTVDKTAAAVGETLTYTVRYVNTTGAAADVTITDKLDANLILVEGSAQGATYADGTLTWVIRNVPAGEAVAVSFQAKVKVAADVTAVSNQAVVAVNGFEVKTNPVTTTVSAPALSAVKTQAVGNGTATGDKLEVTYGDTVTYYIQVSNTGTGKALGVKITDQIPAGLIYKADSASAGGTYTDGAVVWNLAELAPGATVTVSFQVTVPGVAVDTQWKNVASVVSDNTPVENVPSNPVIIVEEGPDMPKTGDDTNLPLLFAMMILSGAAITALLVTTKKKEQTA